MHFYSIVLFISFKEKCLYARLCENESVEILKTGFGIVLSDRLDAHLVRGKQNARDTPSRKTKHTIFLSPSLSLPPAGPGVVHLKGPFISTCVYCPSCVWPRISLLRFVSPLQRSQCISPALRRGRIWHFDVVPRKGRREINDYAQRTQVRARARGLSDNVETQYLCHFDRTRQQCAIAYTWTDMYTCTRVYGIGAPKRYASERGKSALTAYSFSLFLFLSFSRGLSKGSKEKENVYLYTDGI